MIKNRTAEQYVTKGYYRLQVAKGLERTIATCNLSAKLQLKIELHVRETLLERLNYAHENQMT